MELIIFKYVVARSVGNVRPSLASNPHSYPSPLCAQLLPCLQSSCTLVHLQLTVFLMVDGCGSRPTLKTSHVTVDRRESGKFYPELISRTLRRARQAKTETCWVLPDVLALEMVDQLVKLPKTVSENRIQERTVEHIVADIPVLQVAEELVEVSKVFPEGRIEQRFAEQTIDTPALFLAENVVEMLVTQTQEKIQQVASTHVQHVASTDQVERRKIIKQAVQKAVIWEKINQMTKHLPVQKTMEVSPSFQICCSKIFYS